MKLVFPPENSKCPHPERAEHGRHETYLKDGQTFCRACGEVFGRVQRPPLSKQDQDKLAKLARLRSH